MPIERAKNKEARHIMDVMALADKAAEAPESIGRLALERFRRELLDDDYLDDMIVAIPPTETPTIRKPRR